MPRKVASRLNISRNELRDILMNVNSPMFISFISKTPVQMNQYLDYWKTDPMTGKKLKNLHPTVNPYFERGIVNVSRKYQIITGFDYENSVNNRRENENKEPNFVAKDNWFDVVSKGLVVNKKDGNKFYIRYQFLPTSTLDQVYVFDGDPIEQQLFESYMKQRSHYENQGLDNPLQFQVCALDNLLEVSMNGNIYTLVD